jgi:hypothetical protein
MAKTGRCTHGLQATNNIENRARAQADLRRVLDFRILCSGFFANTRLTVESTLSRWTGHWANP